MREIKVDKLMNYSVFDLNSINDECSSDINEKEIIENQEKNNERVNKKRKYIICDNYGGQSLDELIDFIGENNVVDKIYGKHFQQMTKEERLYLLQVKDTLLKKQGISFAQHALNRMEERFIKEKDIIKAIKNGQIIEYRENENDKVIAIRGCSLTRDKQNVYVIISIVTGKVITTYSNKHWKTHNNNYNLDKYVKDFMIEIPEYYKKQIDFYSY